MTMIPESVESTLTNQLGLTRFIQQRDGSIRIIEFIRREDDKPIPDEASEAVAQLRRTAASTPCKGCGEKTHAHNRTWKQLAKGAIGMAKDALGIDAASDDVVSARWATCMSCAENDRGVCAKCGCHLSAKSRIGSETCPLGKWSAM